ncbi:MAG: hypothetical protein HFE79_04870 [Ruminiclostridium sp.]|jgi:HPt (histidine-containing phosphotransfer) domain-containing protein|nr:hypothetical protein [Ruminiclostridium sp.]
MDLINELEALGVNTQEALRRFSGNSALYVKMLGKLTAAANDLEVMPCIEKEDYETAVTNAHTLKGVTGNLSLTPLYNAYTDITNLLREQKYGDAKSVLEKILPVQSDILECIEKSKS